MRNYLAGLLATGAWERHNLESHVFQGYPKFLMDALLSIQTLAPEGDSVKWHKFCLLGKLAV